MKLNLGCGLLKLDGFVNVDVEPLMAPDVLVDLTRVRWPWDDNSVDEAQASHLLEHIPHGEPFYHFLRELYRVCKPGAKVLIVLPHPSHDCFLSDPTHVHAVMPGTVALFSKRYVEMKAAQGDMLTPFYKLIGVDFDIQQFSYTFDPAVDKDDPELEWKAKHLRNIVFMWSAALTVVK